MHMHSRFKLPNTIDDFSELELLEDPCRENFSYQDFVSNLSSNVFLGLERKSTQSVLKLKGVFSSVFHQGQHRENKTEKDDKEN